MKKNNEIKILMQDGCTAAEAKAHLERGTQIIDDLPEFFDAYMSEWGIDEEEQEKYRAMIEVGKPLQDWGIVTENGKTYYIQYVL